MSNNKFKVLIVEDDANISSVLETLLQTDGYQALTARTCTAGLALFRSHTPDLIILDLGLPDRDGMELIGVIREKSAVPIIVLSARTTERDKVMALDRGANDYIAKPFGSGELLARVRAVLRSGRRFTAGGLVIDYDRRQVFVDGEEIRLTQTEYNIVVLLSEHAGRVMTYAAIVRAVWGGADSGSTKRLQVNMANIRKKFGSRLGDNPYIQNELGVGYRMLEEDAGKSSGNMPGACMWTDALK